METCRLPDSPGNRAVLFLKVTKRKLGLGDILDAGNQMDSVINGSFSLSGEMYT